MSKPAKNAKPAKPADRPPSFFNSVAKDYPEVFAAYESLGEATTHAGPLDEKTVRLVKLALAVGAGLEGAVHSHTRRALAAGVTSAEIEHAVLLGMTTIGLPRTMASVAWVRDITAK